MIGYTTEFVLAKQHGVFRIYCNDVSWQTVEGQQFWKKHLKPILE